jgi:hypothetical protein
MRFKGGFYFKQKLVQGRNYVFRVHNLVKLQDEEEYFILEDPFKIKHFIPAKYYRNYNFQIGHDIICHVDKINCTGRVFLEPHHPVYEKKGIYEFRIKEIEVKPGGITAITILDVFDNQINISSNYKSSICRDNNTIKLKISNVKKGIPEFI